jgi:hypothetical protein
MEKKHYEPTQPGREAEQESFQRYTNPNPSPEINPQPEPGVQPPEPTEPGTRPEPEIEPVKDGQETKSPLRPIDANRSPEDFSQFEHSPQQQPGTIREGNKSHGPVIE